ncbi:MAG: hypothetical protein JXA66_06560, partial [Oligoflexia bacterium]|nr:hypothetical protein [Oligoflexia bacterium]
VKSPGGPDITEVYDAYMRKVKIHSARIRSRTIHPVLDSDEFNGLRKIVPTASEGSIVVISGDNHAVAGGIMNDEIINAIYRVTAGTVAACYTSGHGEPGLDDYNEKGAGITAQVLKDRGVIINESASGVWKNCKILIVNEPEKDLSVEEINALEAFRGTILLLGTVRLGSIRSFLEGRGIFAGRELIKSVTSLANRSYDNALLIGIPEIFSVNGPVVSSGAQSLECDSCDYLAKTEAGMLKKTNSTNVVFARKGNVYVFAAGGIATNFFMRYQGNIDFLQNFTTYIVGPSSGGDFYVKKPPGTEPSLVAISGGYLRIIRLLIMYALPAVVFLLGFFIHVGLKNE